MCLVIETALKIAWSLWVDKYRTGSGSDRVQRTPLIRWLKDLCYPNVKSL